MAGYFFISRKLIKSSLWLSEPFTRGQAWIDLIALTQYQDGQINVAGEVIPVLRGQCGWSQLSLSERWGWSRTKTNNFLFYLENEAKISIRKSNRTTIITICNYEEYQSPDADEKTPERTSEKTSEKHQKDTNNKRIIKDNKRSTPLPPGEGAQENLFEIVVTEKPDQFPEFYSAYPKKRDRKAAEKAYRTATKKAAADAIIAACRRYAAERHADDRPDSDRFTKNAATWLNQECWTNYEAAEAEDTPDDIAGMSEAQRVAAQLRMAGLA